MCVEVATARLRLLRQQLGHKPRQKQHFLCEITTDDIGSAGVGPTFWMFTQDIGLVLGIAFRHVFHFLSSSILSRTRNAVILRIRGRGSGFSSGNWIDPLAVANFERSFAKALTADGVG